MKIGFVVTEKIFLKAWFPWKWQPFVNNKWQN